MKLAILTIVIQIATVSSALTNSTSTSKFGDYEIPTANLSKTCNSYKLDTILLTDEAFESKHKELDETFPLGRDSFEKYLKDKNSKDGIQALKDASSYFIPSIILLIICLLCTPFFCCFLCCDSCCRSKETKRNQIMQRRTPPAVDNRDRAYFENIATLEVKKSSNKLFLLVNTILAVVLIVLGIKFVDHVYATSRAAGKSECAVSHFFNDFKGGIKDDRVTFGGMDGLLYLFDKFTTEINGLSKNTIPDLMLQDQSNNLSDGMMTFFDNYYTSQIESFDVASASKGKKITPDFIQNLLPQINEDVQYQMSQMGVGAWILNFAGNAINQIKDGQGQAILDSVQSMKITLTDFRSEFSNIEKTFMDNFNFDKNVAGFDNVMGIIIGGSVFVLLVNIVMMYMGLVGHKNNFRVQRLLALTKIVFSTIVNLVGLVMIGKNQKFNFYFFD